MAPTNAFPDDDPASQLHRAIGTAKLAIEKLQGIEHAGADGSPAGAVILVEHAREALALADQVLGYSVRYAKSIGVTWERIGEIFGTTKQAAQQRFGGGQ